MTATQSIESTMEHAIMVLTIYLLLNNAVKLVLRLLVEMV